MSTILEWVRVVGASRTRRLLGRLSQVVLGASTLLLVSPAIAQTKTFTLDRAQLSGAPDDGFMVHRPYMGEETRFFINGALGFALNPLRDEHIQDDLVLEGGSPISAQLPVYLTAGLQIQGIVALNLHIPFTPYQFTGSEPSTAAGTSGITDTHSTMNDVRLDGRIRIVESDNRKFRLGAVGGFGIATGTQTGFGGDRASTALLLAAGEYDFGPVLLATHVGPHFRPSRSLGDSADLYVSSELRYALGAYIPLRDNKLRLGLEIWGSTGMSEQNGESTFMSKRNTTVEWLAQGRFLVSKDRQTFFNVGAGTRLSAGYGSADVRALLSIGRYWGFSDRKPASPPPRVHVVDNASYHATDSDGDGYPDDIDKCPTVKEDGKKPAPSDGCPAAADADGDGIPDDLDKCPNDPEDFDKIEDKDGCPETDADNDAVLDIKDKCPLEPGPPNKDTEKNGCPTLTKVSGDGTVSLLQPIEFDNGRATIKPGSLPILKEVATLMVARPEIKIAIHGHTDSRGVRESNVKLSTDRAASVMNYLIGQGINKSRLTSDGFGPDKPIDSNDTDTGRAHNRRVEFVIQGGEAKEDASWE